MEEKLKWYVAAGLVGFFGFSVWQFVRESLNPRRRGDEPWEAV